MGVDVAHLVEEALGDANDHVVEDRADGPQGGDSLAPAMVQYDRDEVLLGAAEGHVDMRKVLGELAPGALNGDDPRADVDAHCGENLVSISVADTSMRTCRLSLDM